MKRVNSATYFTSQRLINVSTEQESILFGSDGDQLTSLKKRNTLRLLTNDIKFL